MSEAFLSMPTCPRCGAPMRLARMVAASFGYPELRSFACTECREAVTVEVKTPKAGETQGGIRV